jgi:hypothetical protein
MKSLFAVLALVFLPVAANAHALDQGHGFVEQISHQFLGSHHLPLWLLIGLAAVLAVRALRRRGE